jgi:predicted ATPase/DNA-binding SARP family transcriptional activator
VSDETNYSPREVPLRERGEAGSVVAFPRTRPPTGPTDNLPLELTSFVGRGREIAEVERLLSERRLVTLCGPGGSGKTRLALAVAQDVAEEFEGGVWWVELAPLSDPDLVPQAVVQALRVPEAPDRSPTEALVEYLKSEKALLVLDNCEHLVEACADLADALLRACPDLEILATSREPLRVAGETNFMVPSLSLPDPKRLPPTGELERYEAVRLFAERARSQMPAFVLTPENTPAVVDICRKLNGIPLAIELAAARTRVLSVKQISEKLEDPLGLLTTGDRTGAARHKTLRATLRWSYGLLSEAERTLFRRLSVFVGGFTLEAAEEVCSGEGIEEYEVLDLLSNLVDKSLVLAEADAEETLRYRMLEPVKQFGREKLREDQEEPEVRRRHAEHYLAFAERAESELMGPDQGLWLGRLRTEFANLREAYSWSLEPVEDSRERQQELRLRLVGALWRFWEGERFEEGKQWLETALERDPGGFPAVRAKALKGLGFILLFQQDYERALAALEEAIALCKELGDGSGAGWALANLGWAVFHGDYDERVPAFVEEAEALMSGELDGHARAFLRSVVACAALREGEFDSAVTQLEESLELRRELGNLRGIASSLVVLGLTELRRGDLDRGAALLEEGARIAQEIGDMLDGLYYVWVFGKLSAMRERLVRAARLWGAGEALRERMGVPLSKFVLVHSDYERDLAAVRSTLEEATFEAAWAEGRTMSFEQAIEYALEKSPTPHEEGDPDATAAGMFVPRGEAQASAAETVAEAAALRIFALGPARVEKEGRPLDSPDWIQKPRELLYYLLSHPDGRTKEQIGLVLWPEASSSQLRSSFHDTLYRLRRALGAKDWVSFQKGRYAFGRSLEYSYDVEAFEENVSEARRLRIEGPDQAIRHLQEAADLYRGDYLEDLAVEGEWAFALQEELRRSYQEALLLLGGLLGAQNRHAEAAEAYRKAIAHDRFLEEAHRGLMRSQATMGERGRALRHYEELVRLLKDELGSSPAPETSALYERLRGGRSGE